ncbi:MAG: transglycosylase domain-containing protein [Patescibacteria group bacterium]|nr:transglycosylase domain-containing protein [Patescibacteria group bacterium]
MRKSPLHRFWRHVRAHTFKDIVILAASAFCVIAAVGVFWISSLHLPDLTSFESREVTQSTKIYDSTGTILLYDLNQGVKRTVLPSEDISPFIKEATVAIEDEDFYHHGGIKVSSIIRALWDDLLTGHYSEGGSTITQQVVKNTLLTGDKTITRKLKELVLAIKLDNALPKDQILTIYLNENPYGGNLYGVEEASRQFFGKDASDVTLAEAAYLAAIPQATTYYSPYGTHLNALETRKNLVLQKMLDLKFITQDEYDAAIQEKVQFQPQNQSGIKAPHFVFFVQQYLDNLLGAGTIEQGGYKIITTLNMDLQSKAEDLVKTTALSNEQNFEAKNAALVAIDPQTGGIVSMVGSRDYFDQEIDGKFNVAVDAQRQPGSTMKPIIYSEAFMKGYTPDTVLFDVPTEFSTDCMPSLTDMYASSTPLKSGAVCYKPGNYDNEFRGPISMRDALAQSINVPSVKVLYLAGVDDSLNLAKNMGLTSLTSATRYGLTLVLGGGEVTLLNMTSAYGSFADDGTHVPYTPILHIYGPDGAEIMLPQQQPVRVLPATIAETISNILSDNTARTPAYGPNSVLYFPTRDVAVKTGTTNDSRDAWTIGYTPNLVVGVWAGNNDDSPMVKKVAGQIVAPMWSAFMHQALDTLPDERFIPPPTTDETSLKPVLQGIWEGGQTYTIDTISGKLATSLTPPETRKEVPIQSVHSILYWINRNNPLGPAPTDPTNDPQFTRWEIPVRLWAAQHGYTDQSSSTADVPTSYDDVHTPANMPSITLSNINPSQTYSLDDTVSILVNETGRYPLSKASLYVNDSLVESINRAPFVFRFSPRDISGIQESNQVRVVGVDSVYDKTEASTTMSVALDSAPTPSSQ